MDRKDFQRLAAVRIAEAKALLDLSFHEGAYYLAGYAVECALKACIAKRTRQEEFPPKVDFVRDCYSHRIDPLILAAGLKAAYEADTKLDRTLERNWEIAKLWNESSRYEGRSMSDAQGLYHAITHPVHGVLPWIKSRW